MKWEFREPKLADMIRVKLGDLYHYGIFVSEDEVIQFGLAPTLRTIPECEVEVCKSDIDTFLAGGFLEVGVLDKQERKKRIPPERTVSIARGHLGERGYHILFNNCEHFAHLCVFGIKYSSQAEAFRDRIRAIPVFDVYIAKVPTSDELSPLYPKQRDKEVCAVKNDEVKRHKYYAWKLLEHALLHTFAYDIKQLEFTKSKSGKWLSPSCEFSISHSGAFVAVALSRNPLGVDIQVQKRLASTGFDKRILTEKELGALSEIVGENERNEHLLMLWSKKESIFKMQNSYKYIPAEIETSDYDVYYETLDFDGEKYHLSAVGADASKIRIFKDVCL